MAIHTFIGDASKWGKPGYVHSDENYRVTYEGAVLQLFERNGYHDSDFMAIVWDEDAGTIKTVTYATTRGWTYANSAEVDATPEVLAKAQEARRAANIRLNILAAEHEASTPIKGKAVRVIGTGKNADRPRRWKGEVIEAGAEGTVFWKGTDSFRSSRWHTSYRLGVELDDGRKVFGPDDAFEVVDPEQYVPSVEELEAQTPPAETIKNFHVGVPGFVNMVG